MKEALILTDEGEKMLDLLFNCKDVRELKDNYFPKNSLTELVAALNYASSVDCEYIDVDCFLEGIEYQKLKSKPQSGGGVK